jgi:hypothetical protein
MSRPIRYPGLTLHALVVGVPLVAIGSKIYMPDVSDAEAQHWLDRTQRTVRP